MPPLLLKLVFDHIAAGPMPFFVRPVAKAIAGRVQRAFIAPQLRTHLDFMEGELAASPWFAGADFSAADAQMSFPLEAAVQCGGLDASRPRLIDWLARIHARPAYRRALVRGGPYAFAS